VLAHPIHVLVVDDHGIVREAVKCLLEQLAQMLVVGSASSGKEAVVAAKRLKPDLILMDLVLPELNGLDAIERILALMPETRIIVLSMCQTSQHVAAALRAGARGYVVKQAATKELHRAVLTVMRGKRYLSPQIADFASNTITRNKNLSPLEHLSAREREVLHLTVAGMTSAAMALKLNLSRKSVETYRSRIIKKLCVTDHAALIRFAIEHALTPA